MNEMRECKIRPFQINRFSRDWGSHDPYNALMHNASTESNNAVRGRQEQGTGEEGRRQTALTADERNVFHKMLDFCPLLQALLIYAFHSTFNQIILIV